MCVDLICTDLFSEDQVHVGLEVCVDVVSIDLVCVDLTCLDLVCVDLHIFNR